MIQYYLSNSLQSDLVTCLINVFYSYFFPLMRDLSPDHMWHITCRISLASFKHGVVSQCLPFLMCVLQEQSPVILQKGLPQQTPSRAWSFLARPGVSVSAECPRGSGRPGSSGWAVTLSLPAVSVLRQPSAAMFALRALSCACLNRRVTEFLPFLL